MSNKHMIESIKLIGKKASRLLEFDELHKHKIEIYPSFLKEKSITIQIEFNCDIVSFRNHDYTWVDLHQNRISNWYSPKIIKLKDDLLIQANQQVGIWEVKKAYPNKLFWHINPNYSKPIVSYDSNNSKHIIDANSSNVLIKPLGLLSTNDFAIEISRSKIAFSAIACFTDHCDFDTLSNLIQQREFFKKNQIKLTKGFFLNDFSKRNNTACIVKHKDELKKWIDDGHELAYHSLSQSIKPFKKSIQDFKSFDPPFLDVCTWIDHGFQPYNFTLFNNHQQIRDDYGLTLRSKQIYNLWNYVDTGTSVKGVINQINPNQFTLETFYLGVRHLGFKKAISMFIKDVVFHYFNNDYSLRLYREVAKYFKTLKQKKSIKKHFSVIVNAFKLLKLLLPILLFWNSRKRRTYPLAKFSPVIFSHNINGKTFKIFQTLEMIDFKMGLCKNNIDLLIKEQGMFIAHTYFSAPMNYHQGKLFGSVNKIDEQVDENFKYLSHKIQSKEIWNPTLSELINHLKKVEHIIYDCNENGKIIVECDESIEFRKVR